MQKSFFVKSSALVFLFTLLGFVFDLALRVALVELFGVSRELDIFLLAYSIPQWIAGVLALAVQRALIPFYIGILQEDRGQAGRFFGLSVLVSGGVVSVLLGLVAIGVGVYTMFNLGWFSGLVDDPLFSSLLLLLLPYVFIVLLISFLNSLFQARQEFMWSSFLFFVRKPLHVGLLFLMVAAAGIYSAVWALVVASLISLLGFVVVAWRKGWLHGDRGTLMTDVDKGRLHEFFLIASPLVLGSLVYKSITVVDQYLASWVGEGYVVYVNYARELSILPSGLLGASVATVLVPLMAKHFSASRRKDLGGVLLQGLRLVLFLTIPVLVYLWLFADEIVELFFGGGFAVGDVAETATLLRWYLGYTFGTSIATMLTSFLYAIRRTKEVVFVGVVGSVVNVVLNLLLVRVLGGPGLAFASSLVAVGNLILFWWVIRRLGDYISFRVLAKAVWRHVAAFGVLFVSSWVLLGVFDGSLDSVFVRVVAGGVLVGGLFVVISALFQLGEIAELKLLVESRTRRTR